MVKDAEEDGRETSLYCMKVLERQLAVVELTIDEYALHDLLDKRFDPIGSGLLQVTRGCLHCIGQHEYARFFRLWSWSHVPEVHFLDRY